MNEIGLYHRDLDMPALWVDLDCVERNIAALARYIKTAGVAWRPSTQGIKVPATTRFRGLTFCT